ncbi:MAG: ThiF family adenylyltransferase [Candidatus Hermodarchaeota archaeon]
MFEKKNLRQWSNSYWNQINRNLGLIKIQEQEKLRKTSIAVFGLGGLGGPLVEQLIRIGCENLKICDNERYEESNLNRQICTREDLGYYKVEHIEKLAMQINPEVKIQKYYNVNEENIYNILKNTNIASLTLDDPIISILISRACKKNKIPMIEAWAIPYICTWWFNQESIDYETCYGLKTKDMTIKQMINSKKTSSTIKKNLLSKLLQFPGIKDIYNREEGTVDNMISGKLTSRSLSPIVRINASFLAFDIIYAGILKIKQKVLAPNINGYDYLRMKPIRFEFK